MIIYVNMVRKKNTLGVSKMVNLNNLDHMINKMKQADPELTEVLESVEYKRSRIIFQKRMDLGITQSELAIKANVTQKTISRIEGADVGIRPTTLNKVYGALGLGDSYQDKSFDEISATI